MTLTIDLIDSGAIKLLRELERLNLIRVNPPENTAAPEGGLSERSAGALHLSAEKYAEVSTSGVQELPLLYRPEPFPTIEELKAEAATRFAEMERTGVDPLAQFAGSLKDVFPEDGLEYQRKMRDEWPD
jgi:hypothetical protein